MRDLKLTDPTQRFNFASQMINRISTFSNILFPDETLFCIIIQRGCNVGEKNNPPVIFRKWKRSHIILDLKREIAMHNKFFIPVLQDIVVSKKYMISVGWNNILHVEHVLTSCLWMYPWEIDIHTRRHQLTWPSVWGSSQKWWYWFSYNLAVHHVCSSEKIYNCTIANFEWYTAFKGS